MSDELLIGLKHVVSKRVFFSMATPTPPLGNNVLDCDPLLLPTIGRSHLSL